MVKGVIFDLDGTLLNSIYDLTASCNTALKSLNLEEITIEEGISFIGNGVKMLVKRALKGKDEYLDEALAIFNKDYFDNCTLNSKVYDGIYDLLKYLKDNNILIGIASNKKEEYITKIVDHYFSSYIDSYHGETSILRRKPEGDIVYKVLDDLGLSKEDVLYIGDSEVDIKTVSNLNMKGVFVSYGFRTKEELLKYNVNVVDSVEEIKKYL